MRVMHRGKWLSGFLPYSPEVGVRVSVQRWALLLDITDLYFVVPKSLRLLLSYYREIGCHEVFKKIKSRMAESLRNEKFCSIGYGIATIDKKEVNVVFIAPCHPMCVDELVLPIELMVEVDKNCCDSNALYFYDARGEIAISQLCEKISGWSIYSGIDLSEIRTEFKTQLLNMYNEIQWDNAKKFSFLETQLISPNRKRIIKSNSFKPSAAIMGYGQYAKTNIIPNIKNILEIKKIYEIDPLQIPNSKGTIEWSTNAYPDMSDNFNVFFIAGYHHTHAPIACEIIKKGMVAVVEKPLVVNVKQLDQLIATIEESSGKLYTCYHKRYALFNDFIFNDLQCERGAAVNFHCIVHEVPLPKNHWYNWPNSHSRILSNGCHWIDYFLYLNDYSNFTRYSGEVAPDGTINCSITLENGAFFSMVLTDQGSSRIGVQEYIELRRKNLTVKIVNANQYVAENEKEISRKFKIYKLHGYAKMYSDIAKDVKLNLFADSLMSIKITNQLILGLETKLYPEMSLL